MKNKTLKIILAGNYGGTQIRALLPSFILTQENQSAKSKIKNRNDFDILEYEVKTIEPELKEVFVKWRPKI